MGWFKVAPTGAAFNFRIGESRARCCLWCPFLIAKLFGVGGNGEERGGKHGSGDVPVPDVLEADLVAV